MAALVCEICGGKLMGKPGGIFECDSCGMEYSTEWAKAKIQEIKGTVKVEGTVEVRGTVKIENSVTVENMLRRGFDALADGNFEEGEIFFQRALDIDPDCGDALFGLALNEVEHRTPETFWEALEAHKCSEPNPFKKMRNTKLSDQLSARLKVYDDRLAEQIRAIDERKSIGAEKSEEYRVKREQAFRAKGLTTDDMFGWFLDVDGKLKCANSDIAEVVESIDFGSEEYCDIVQIFKGRGWESVVCLRSDGSVFELKPVRIPAKLYGEKDSYELQKRDVFSKEEKVIQVVCTVYESAYSVDKYVVCGLREDGTIVVCTDGYCSDGSGEETRTDVFHRNAASLSDVTRLYVERFGVYALRDDGTAYEICYGKECPIDNIAAISSDNYYHNYVIYLHTDGTVSYPRKKNEKIWYEISKWTDIVDIAIDHDGIVGLKADGTICYSNKDLYRDREKGRDFKNLVAICAGFGIKSDGTLIDTSGSRYAHEFPYKLFDNINTLKQEQEGCAARRQKAQEEIRNEKRKLLNEECALLANELPTLKGLFSGKRRKEIETRLAEIEKELKALGG